MAYTAKKFDLPELAGISAEQVKVHLALYEGYVKHVNLILSTIAAYGKTDDEGGAYAIAELRRRLAFEFCGMRMHEYYFEQFRRSEVGTPTDASEFTGNKGGSVESALAKAAAAKYGSGENFIAHIKEVARTRGIGWVVVWWDGPADGTEGTLHTTFVGDHELGQLAGLPVILALDMWEHAYMVDYRPGEKGTYVDAFLNNIDWSLIEARFDATTAAKRA